MVDFGVRWEKDQNIGRCCLSTLHSGFNETDMRSKSNKFHFGKMQRHVVGEEAAQILKGACIVDENNFTQKFVWRTIRHAVKCSKQNTQMLIVKRNDHANIRQHSRVLCAATPEMDHLI